MSTKLVLVLVLLFSFVLGRILHELRARFVLPSPVLYAVIGLVLGPLALALLDARVVDAVQPSLSLLLGLIGFGKGLALRRRPLARRAMLAGAVGGLLVACTLGAATQGLLHLTTWLAYFGVWPALAIGSIAAVVDDRALDALADRAGAAGPSRDLLRSFAQASTIVALCAFGASLTLARSVQAGSASPAPWMLAAVAAWIACGLLFWLYTGPAVADQRILVGTMGILALVSGLASATGTSPLLAGFATGVTASFLSHHAEAVGDALEPLRTPALIGVMVLAGAMWAPPPAPILWVLPAVFVALRVPALRLAGWLAPRLVPGVPRPPRLGAPLLPQGALGVAIAVNFAQVHPASGPLVLTVAFVGAALGDALGYGAVRRVLADAGDIVHRARPASNAGDADVPT